MSNILIDIDIIKPNTVVGFIMKSDLWKNVKGILPAKGVMFD